MRPFATLRARALLTGGLVITLLVVLALGLNHGSDGFFLFTAYPLLGLWAIWLARHHGVRLRRLAGPAPPPDQTVAILALVPALVALDVGTTWMVYTPISWISPEGVRTWLERLDRLMPENLSRGQDLLFTAGLVLLAPVVEELIFRGLLLHRWSLKWGPRRGLVSTTLAFALLHPSPVNAFLLGLGFGVIYLRTGSLFLTMVAHALNNLIASKLLPFIGPDPVPGSDALAAFHDATGQALILFGAGATILWLGRPWYWPDLRQPMPYERALPGELGSRYRVPSTELPLPRMPDAGASDSALGTRSSVLDSGIESRTEGDMTVNLETATLAGGCFWCLEAAFQQLRGVHKVTSGYAGGTVAGPSYQAVCGGTTGHAEVVQVEFDPGEISYRDLLEVFFTIHDPTTLNRQGADVGTQYRSAIFYHSPEQKGTAEQTIAEYSAEDLWGAPIVTEVRQLEQFYPAETYHHDYFTRNPYQPYCLAVVAPKVAKVRSKYAARIKA